VVCQARHLTDACLSPYGTGRKPGHAAVPRPFPSATCKKPISTVAFGQRPPKKIAALSEGYLQDLQSEGTCIQAYPVRVISVDRERLLLTSAAAVALVAYGTSLQAADMAVKAPPPPYVPPQFNWTGFYIGGNVGGGAATGTVFDTIGASLGSIGGDASFVGGGQIGYNWQFSPNLVFGIDWFFDGISNNNGGSVTFVSPVTGDLITGSGKADWVTTITGRLGFTARKPTTGCFMSRAAAAGFRRKRALRTWAQRFRGLGPASRERQVVGCLAWASNGPSRKIGQRGLSTNTSGWITSASTAACCATA
jgi:hypothetical protein